MITMVKIMTTMPILYHKDDDDNADDDDDDDDDIPGSLTDYADKIVNDE